MKKTENEGDVVDDVSAKATTSNSADDKGSAKIMSDAEVNLTSSASSTSSFSSSSSSYLLVLDDSVVVTAVDAASEEQLPDVDNATQNTVDDLNLSRLAKSGRVHMCVIR